MRLIVIWVTMWTLVLGMIVVPVILGWILVVALDLAFRAFRKNSSSR